MTGYHNVLMVEDDDALCRVVDRNLTARGVSVRRAGSVADALAAIAADRPDLVLLDIDLPDRTGWDLMRALAAHEMDLPTIVITGTRVTPERLPRRQRLARRPQPLA